MTVHPLKRTAALGGQFPTAILDSLSEAVVVVDASGLIHYANLSAEQFFGVGRARLIAHPLSEFMPEDAPLFSLLEQVIATGGAVAENGVTLVSPRIGNRFCALRLSPVVDSDGLVAVSLVEQTIARNIDRQMSHRSAARSVSALAAMLAHEVKNPLSGIRGAAQLIEQSVADSERELTRLICEETDRIVALVDRMEAFADGRPIERGPINIHQVLNHVRRIAQNGFGKGVRFIETYDPSLPDVHGDRDQLIQVFLNLVKNACEVPGDGDREIELSTAYRHGLRLAVPGQQAKVNLPLVVSVRDNGGGVPEEIRAHLFDAFVTNKPTGTGLGLALVAKIINDHGGAIEFESEPGRTVFRVMLPLQFPQGTS
ncbi:MAG: nitrogen regulation protein NR(II) [Reyranella sp.]|uniref:two-component system sensor histidine kinase NtrB n=1 Tax=Reyranella sp. TaxID=1929291 RepID=UPI003D09DB8E